MMVILGTLISIVVIFLVNFLHPTLMTQLQPPNVQDAHAISHNDREVDKQKLDDGCYHIFRDVGLCNIIYSIATHPNMSVA